MSYSVEWSAEARAQLAATWLQQVASRQAITSAQARIDKMLAADPARFGAALSEGLFAIEQAPLRALYEISDAERRVEVVAVRWSL
jgi:hypothetical protein